MSLMSPALAGMFFTTSTTWEALIHDICQFSFSVISLSGFSIKVMLALLNEFSAVVLKFFGIV